MKQYPFAAARVFGTPLAIHPGKGMVIAQALAEHMGFAPRRPRAGDEEGVEWGEAAADGPTYEVVRGVAVIPVGGTLVHKSSWLDAFCGMRGYDAIRRDVAAAITDTDVRALCLAVDSPGGEVSGCFDLVDYIHGCRGEKPIWSILDDSAYSAAYALASAADHITVPRTGGTGSVGVIAMHADLSKAMEGEGISIELITYGDRKADGNPYSALGKEARSRFQADVDTMGELFVETVARNLDIPVARVRATQAATYMGGAGVACGFADAVMAPDEAFRALLAELGK